MKNFKSSTSTSMERAAIRVAPSGKAATKAFAALLVLELALGTFGCSKSKPAAQISQNSSNQTAASVAAPAIPNTAPVTVNQPDTGNRQGGFGERRRHDDPGRPAGFPPGHGAVLRRRADLAVELQDLGTRPAAQAVSHAAAIVDRR